MLYTEIETGQNIPAANDTNVDWMEHKGGSTLVTLPRTVTPYRNSVDGTRDRVTYQKLVTR
jgi:hypothetical protein